jgi:hypothetical protein
MGFDNCAMSTCPPEHWTDPDEDLHLAAKAKAALRAAQAEIERGHESTPETIEVPVAEIMEEARTLPPVGDDWVLARPCFHTGRSQPQRVSSGHNRARYDDHHGGVGRVREG